MSDKAPRIAISFGGSTISGAKQSSSSKTKPPSSLGKRSRPSALGGNDSDSDSDGSHGRHEAITEIGGDGKPERKRAKELVIEKQKNRDWKSDVRAKRGGKNLLPPEVQAQRAARDGDAAETEPADADKNIQWGLTVTKRKTSEEPAEQGATTSPQADDDTRQGDGEAPEPSADDEAIDALMGRKKESEQHTIPRTETDAYRADVERNVGADSTLDDYDAIPDGEFGAAILRGMGWDGQLRGPKAKAAGERRQNQLGLGAKKLKDAEDLGQWNHGGKKRDSRPPKLSDYRREEERKKAERRERRGEGYREERERERHRDGDRRRYDEYDRRDRDRDRDRDRGRDRDGHSSRRY